MDRPKSIKDILSGLIFIIFGAAFGFAASGYEFGTALRMGPGYFPIVLAVALVGLGVAILWKGLTVAVADRDLGIVSWRAVILITAALLFFGATVRGLGLVPALFVTTLVSSLASVENTPVRALTIAVLMTAFCVAIFHFGLGVAVPLFGPWLGG